MTVGDIFDDAGNLYDDAVGWTADRFVNAAGAYDSAVNWTSDQMTNASDWANAQWQDAVARWRGAVAQFSAQMNEHASLRPVAEALGADELAQWQSVQNRADAIKNTVTTLSDSLSQISNWASQTIGMAGLSRMAALPLVPIAVITGSIAAVVAITSTLYTYDSGLKMKWAYIQAHPDATPEQVAAVLNAGGSPFSVGGNLGVWIVVAGVMMVFGPELLKYLNKKRR